jgi:nucleoside-diphosphate-sugar epimerase
MIRAAQATGAVLAITGNLYGYGPVSGPMTEDLPLAATGRKGRVRAKMWHDALAAGMPTFEARASDYIGLGAASVITNYLLPAVAARRTLRIPADIDLPHSFTYTGDVARALVTMARDERAWGRPWHVPSNPPLTIRELTRRFFEVTGQAPVKVVGMPRWLPRAAGLFSSMVREFNEMDYQFYAPFELDTSAATRTFGLRPTPLDDALRAAVPVPA